MNKFCILNPCIYIILWIASNIIISYVLRIAYSNFEIRVLNGFDEKLVLTKLNQFIEAAPVRLTGSNELEIATKKIKSLLVEITGNYSHASIIEQNAGGSFPIKFLGSYVNSYTNITNIIYKIGPKLNESLLINCHYDSVFGSPGANDDAIACFIMFEIIRNLIQSSTNIQIPIIFLFNGAEEQILQGSHAFMAYHPLAKNVKAVINLDACGTPGRPLLFQTGLNDWLVRAYAKTSKKIFGGSLYFSLFRSGAIPMQTDFHIFHNMFGIQSAIDLAFIDNNYVYHTQYDQARFISQGAVQSAGQDLLALIQEIQALGYEKFEALTRTASRAQDQLKSIYETYNRTTKPAPLPFMTLDLLGIHMFVYPTWLNMLYFAIIAITFSCYMMYDNNNGFVGLGFFQRLKGNNSYFKPLASYTKNGLCPYHNYGKMNSGNIHVLANDDMSLPYININKSDVNNRVGAQYNLRNRHGNNINKNDGELVEKLGVCRVYTNGKLLYGLPCKCYKGFLQSISVILASWALALGANIVIAFTMQKLDSQMSWYTKQSYIVFIYLVPPFLACLLVHTSSLNLIKKYENSIRLIYDGALLLTFLFCAFALIFLPDLVNYFLIWMACALMAGCFLRTCIHFKISNVLTIIIHALTILLPLTLTLYVSVEIGRHAIPLLAFAGHTLCPDYIVATYCAAVLLELFHFYTWYCYLPTSNQPLKSKFPKSNNHIKNISKCLSSMGCLKACLGATFFGVFLRAVFVKQEGTPFSADPLHPVLNRQFVIHLNREFYESHLPVNVSQDTGVYSHNRVSNDSGIWILSLDNSGYQYMARQYLRARFNYTKEEIATKFIVNCDSEAHMQCGMPYRLPVHKNFRKTLYVPEIRPNILGTKIQIMKTQGSNTIHIRFRISSFFKVSIAISPYTGFDLTHWSFDSQPQALDEQFRNNRKMFFVVHVNGKPKLDQPNTIGFEFDLNLQKINTITLHNSTTNSEILDIAFSFHHMVGKQRTSRHLENFIAGYPKWIEPTAYVAEYQHFTLY